MAHMTLELTVVESVAVLSALTTCKDLLPENASGMENLERVSNRLVVLQMEYAQKNPESTIRQIKAIRG